MFGLGTWELVIIALIALLLFGSRLPEVARGLGKGVVEFKKGLGDVKDEVDKTDAPASAEASDAKDDGDPGKKLAG